MVNYVLSFCKITGASRLFSRNFYLPLLKPLTPKEALRTYRITGKWLLGAKIQHYIPVLLNHTKKRSERSQNYHKQAHNEMDDYTYMTPVLDEENETHKILQRLLDQHPIETDCAFIYTVHDKRYNIVLTPDLEAAICHGDIIDVLVSQRNDKIIIKLNTMKKIPLEIQYYEGEAPMYHGEGATAPEDEKFHHHGKYTMSLAKIFEDKEMEEEKWEEELRKIMRKRRKQAKEGSKEWREMMKQTIKNLDWTRFEEDAKKVIDEIDEPADEQDIDMEIDDLATTQNVNETLRGNADLMDQLPTLAEIPDIIRSMGEAFLAEIEQYDPETGLTRKVTGVRLMLPSGKECFISGQMVHTEDGDVFVPGQTIENEFGLEYSPGITININGKPTLISGLIMGEEARDPMFLPTQSTITADGQLTFACSNDERPKVDAEKAQLKKQIKADKLRALNQLMEESEESSEETTEESVELNNSELEELDIESMRLKQEQQKQELEKLKAFLLDDGMDDLIASIEDKRALLQKKLDELRQLSITTELNLVSYVTESDTEKVAEAITSDAESGRSLAAILMTMTRRASTLRDKNSIQAHNISQAYIPAADMQPADLNFTRASTKLKMLLKTALVSANDAFKARPKDQQTALQSIAEIIVDVLRSDPRLVAEMVQLMGASIAEQADMTDAILKQLGQNVADTKVAALATITNAGAQPDAILAAVDKILRRASETKCDAFTKLAKNDPKLVALLIDEIKKKLAPRCEEEATEILEEAINAATRKLAKINLSEYFVAAFKTDSECFKAEALSFAKALGHSRVEDKLNASATVYEVEGVEAKEFLERILIIRQLAQRDYSLKSAIERVKKSPERARADPRIRELVRESALLLAKDGPRLQTSREIPTHLLKNQNLLAIEDYLVQRGICEFPVLVTKGALEAVVPREAARGVLAGRVAYTLMDESGTSHFKAMHMFAAGVGAAGREKRMGDYLSGVREYEADGKSLKAAQRNVRKLKKLLNYGDDTETSRQNA